MNEILTTRSVVTASGVNRPLHSNISESEGAFLQDLIRKHRPKVTLEVGCAYGIASLFICEALCEVGGRSTSLSTSDQYYPHGKGPKSGVIIPRQSRGL
jgi:predicted O-methyltransferase YrrM